MGARSTYPVPASGGMLADAFRRLMLRTSAGLLRPVWRLCYSVSARLAAAYLSGRQPDCAVYAVGSVGGPDAVYGVSDIDLVVVAPRASGRPGQAGEAAVARRELLRRALPPLRQLLSVDVFESPDLERAMMRCPSLRTGPSALLPAPPGADAQPPALALRAGLGLPASAWRLLAGPPRLPHAPGHEHQPQVAAWLELQQWWRHAFSACLNPSGPRAPYTCVKLAAEPARIYIWLTRCEWASSRREALEWGLEALPDERDTFERALALLEELHHSPEPPLAEMLAALRRLSAHIGQQLAVDLQQAGATDVRLGWQAEGRLPVPGQHDGLPAVLEAPPLLPLADWRALVWPSRVDECFSLESGDPADPLTLAAMARAARTGPYRALHVDSLLVLPTATGSRAKLRAVQCPSSDPVSFALVEGARTARFPNVAGWSIQDIAGRAVAEHRAWLARYAGRSVSRDALAKLLGCARAALLLESVEQGSPELPADMPTTALSLRDRHPGAGAAAQEAYETLAGNSRHGELPSARTLARLRDRVLEMPAYRHGPRAARMAA
jgi:hypothetical protein